MCTLSGQESPDKPSAHGVDVDDQPFAPVAPAANARALNLHNFRPARASTSHDLEVFEEANGTISMARG